MEQKEKILDTMSREKLIELIGIYSKNWLAMDGFWFQSVERKLGMDEAMFHDVEIWKRFTVTEARRIKAFLGLDEHPGLEGLAQALQLRFYGNINDDTVEIAEDPETGRKKLIYTMVDCYVQSARAKKGMAFHPCKPVGVVEYGGFARTIDDRIQCRCISCYPEVTDASCCCKWEFWEE
jgi:hypothetical protein